MKFHSQIKKLPAEGRQCSESTKQCLYFSFIKLLYKKSINSLDFAYCAKLIIMQQLFFTWIGLCFYRTYILPQISSLFKQYFRKSFCCGYNLPNLLVKCILAKTKLCKFGFLAKKDVRKSQIAWQAFLFYQSRSYCLQSFQTNYRTVYPFTFFVPSLHNLARQTFAQLLPIPIIILFMAICFKYEKFN